MEWNSWVSEKFFDLVTNANLVTLPLSSSLFSKKKKKSSLIYYFLCEFERFVVVELPQWCSGWDCISNLVKQEGLGVGYETPAMKGCPGM